VLCQQRRRLRIRRGNRQERSDCFLYRQFHLSLGKTKEKYEIDKKKGKKRLTEKRDEGGWKFDKTLLRGQKGLCIAWEQRKNWGKEWSKTATKNLVWKAMYVASVYYGWGTVRKKHSADQGRGQMLARACKWAEGQ